MRIYLGCVATLAVVLWSGLVGLVHEGPAAGHPAGAMSRGHDSALPVPVDPDGRGPSAVAGLTVKLRAASLPETFDPSGVRQTVARILRECGISQPCTLSHECQPGGTCGLPGEVRPAFVRPATELLQDRRVAEERTGRALPDLRTWFRWTPGPGTGERFVADGLFRLGGHPAVVTAYRTPRFSPAVIPPGPRPADDTCPIRTPEFDPLQGYAGPAPGGIGMATAWERPGGRGEGIQFADIEGAWNAAHEDLPGSRIEHVAGRLMPDRGWEAHGTAVVGVVASRDNDLGMVGLTPDVDRIYTGSLGGIGAAAAIDQVSARMNPGDVLLIELHGPGPRSRFGQGQKGFVPMEYWDAEFEAIQVATARGIVVVEAAGNGGEDLDDPIYEGKFDRALRDSGALMVGAGAPLAPGYTDRSRLDFSNHGSRVDLQGWGRGVATLDYGDLQRCSGNDREYTVQFSGTSSASPVVVGAVIAVQGIHKARTGSVLSTEALVSLLSGTGSPQTDGPHGPATQNIGPRPDLERALHVLDQMTQVTFCSPCF